MKKLVLITLALTPWNAMAEKIHIDLAVGLSHFEQQVKMEVGGAKGNVLVGDSELGFATAGTYAVKDWLELGVFVRIDFGNRRSGQFSSFDSEGVPVIVNTQGGHFSEVWIGPLVRYRSKHWFAELGYGLFGTRTDASRSDLANTSGATSGAFSTSAAVAWMLGLGSTLEISKTISLLMRLEYRIRYYNERDGKALAGNMVHGTQNLTPQLGLTVKL